LPKFSIVIAAYNREHQLPRAIRSCLVQGYADLEVTVVDDGSTDGSYAVAAAIEDPRLKVIRHPSNQGANAARNTGTLAAAGEWIISLDSDDELAPDSLETIATIAETVPHDVHRIGFMYSRDDGRVSPLPGLREQVVDYAAYIAWMEGRQLWDFLMCTRKCTFENTKFPEGLWTDLALYQLDFAKRYKTLFREEIVAVVHTDASNRLSYRRRSRKYSSMSAASFGRELDDLLDRHGEGLRRFAPNTFQMYRRMRAACHFLEGNRIAGARGMLDCLRQTPFLVEAWVLFVLGLANRGALAAARSWRRPAT
jgi:glycosyltransferase involved in cell wall biosynthesis